MEKLDKKIFLLVSNWIISNGLERVINKLEGFEVIGTANTVQDFFLKTENSYVPDICIIYVEKDETIASIISDIKAKFLFMSTIVLGSDVNRNTILQIMATQTEVYIYKDCNEKEFYQAILASSNKNKFYCEKILDKMLELPVHNKSCDLIGLTDREIDVIRCIANGRTTKETANTLGLSHHTVATHRKNIFRKLEIKSGSELVRYALENKLLSNV